MIFKNNIKKRYEQPGQIGWSDSEITKQDLFLERLDIMPTYQVNKIAVQRPGSKKKYPFLDPQHQREAIFYIDPFFSRKLT